jgi:hypothetical protein
VGAIRDFSLLIRLFGVCSGRHKSPGEYFRRSVSRLVPGFPSIACLIL